MTKKRKHMPKFKNEDAERAFWANHDSTEYVDWSAAARVKFPNLKPSLISISIRLPESLLNDLKILANKKDVPYQSLMKLYLSEKVQAEHTRQ